MGRGFATEIGRAALERAGLDVPDLHVITYTEVHNHASQAVVRRIGLRERGRIEREGLIEGREQLQHSAWAGIRHGPPGTH